MRFVREIASEIASKIACVNGPLRARELPSCACVSVGVADFHAYRSRHLCVLVVYVTRPQGSKCIVLYCIVSDL